jgi:hypothetical protein
MPHQAVSNKQTIPRKKLSLKNLIFAMVPEGPEHSGTDPALTG